MTKETKSPCNNICKLNRSDVCIGCLRTADEIAGWSRYSEVQKQAVLERIESEQILEAG